jgi:adenylate cyclase
VPIIGGDEILGLIYIYTIRPGARPFDPRDLQIAIAISHQAALTIQRMRLMRRVRREQQMRERLQRFVPPAEAEALAQTYLKTGHLPEPAEKTVTVLFADIRDSTGLAERLSTRRFSATLMRYYQTMTDVIFEHGGLINKFLGDGLLAVFGMEPTQAEPEARAVRAGLGMLKHLTHINTDLPEPITVGIGINTGLAMAGYLDMAERIEFTILGDAVNVAAGLESLARPNRVFIGPATYQAVVGQFPIRELGPIEIKKRAHRLNTYEVIQTP